MFKPDDRGRLIYGSVKEIKRAYKAGAGCYYRADVKLLLKRIKELEKE